MVVCPCRERSAVSFHCWRNPAARRQRQRSKELEWILCHALPARLKRYGPRIPFANIRRAHKACGAACPVTSLRMFTLPPRQELSSHRPERYAHSTSSVPGLLQDRPDRNLPLTRSFFAASNTSAAKSNRWPSLSTSDIPCNPVWNLCLATREAGRSLWRERCPRAEEALLQHSGR